MVSHTPTSWQSQAALRALIRTPDLDGRVAREPELLTGLSHRVKALSREAWTGQRHGATLDVRAARLAAQRALYELNRLKLYWGDDPDHYANEQSATLLDLQIQLEAPFERWLDRQVPAEAFAQAGQPNDGVEMNPSGVLSAWASGDRTPTLTRTTLWFAEEMNLAGYRHLLAIGSLNGLVEASQLSRVLGGTPDAIQTTLARIFVEDYGAGRIARKHSTYFANMLEGQGMSTEPEAYFFLAPWEVLAVINHAFYLSENKRHYLRFCGAFTYREVSTPASFDAYVKAAERLKLSFGRGDYWSLHVCNDMRHGAWTLHDIALPLMQRFPERRQDVLLGYAQQRVLEGMAAAATARACQHVARSQPAHAPPSSNPGVW